MLPQARFGTLVGWIWPAGRSLATPGLEEEQNKSGQYFLMRFVFSSTTTQVSLGTKYSPSIPGYVFKKGIPFSIPYALLTQYFHNPTWGEKMLSVCHRFSEETGADRPLKAQ